MSKMSQLAMELDEQAVELGFKDREDAMKNGYEVVSDGTFARLVKTETEQEEAHNAWLEERDSVIDSLNNAIYHNRRNNDGKGTYEQTVMQRAKEFIEKGEV